MQMQTETREIPGVERNRLMDSRRLKSTWYLSCLKQNFSIRIKGVRLWLWKWMPFLENESFSGKLVHEMQEGVRWWLWPWKAWALELCVVETVSPLKLHQVHMHVCVHTYIWVNTHIHSSAFTVVFGWKLHVGHMVSITGQRKGHQTLDWLMPIMSC